VVLVDLTAADWIAPQRESVAGVAVLRSPSAVAAF
jgi:hypothetical protein